MRWNFIEVEKRHEEEVIELLRGSPFTAFLPKKQRYFKKQDYITVLDRLLFPGTVIITSDLPQDEFASQFNTWLEQHPTVLIHHEAKEYFYLSNDEQHFIASLMDEHNVIHQSIGILDAKRLIIQSGPLKGLENRIKKIDRHQRTAQVQFQICGQVILLYLGLIVKPSD